MKSIKLRLIISFTMIILFVTGALGLMSIRIISDKLITDAKDDLAVVAQTEAKYVEAMMNVQISYIQSLANNPLINRNSPAYTKEESITFLASEATRTGYISYAFADLNGSSETLDSTGEILDVSDREYYQKALNGEANVSDIIISKITGEPILVFAAPAFDRESQIGVFYGRKDGTALCDFANNIKYGENGYGYMINTQGTVVGHPNKELVLTQYNFIEEAKNNSELEDLGALVAEHMVLGEVGSGEYLYEGSERIVGFAPVANTPWIMVVGLHKSEILNRVNEMKTLLTTLVIGAVILGAAITYFISRSIAKPIVAVTKDIQKQANLDFTIDNDLQNAKYNKRKDEIGKMLSSLELMQSNVRDFILKTLATAQQVAASSEELTATAEQAAVAAEEVSKTIEEIAQGASEQAKDTEVTANNVEELGNLLEQDSEYIKDLNLAALKIDEEKENGFKILKILVNKSQQNYFASQSIYEAIMSNNASAEKIESASLMIQSIADQTNLLALNAAIEAARAGDAGRGFAVVADEIRNLAEQSNSFTSEIKAVIEELKSKSENAVQTVIEVREIVDAQAVSVKDTEDRFEGIAKAIDSIKIVIEKLNHSVELMTGNKHKIIELTQNLSAISEENAAGTEEASASMEEQAATIDEIANSAEGLAGVAQELNVLIEKFKI